jgi:hypothetical protein
MSMVLVLMIVNDSLWIFDPCSMISVTVNYVRLGRSFRTVVGYVFMFIYLKHTYLHQGYNGEKTQTQSSY